MKISEMYKKGKVISLEIFPPKNGESLCPIYQALYSLITTRQQNKPKFVSVTSGAMGNLRSGTIQIASDIQQRYDIPALSHLTLAGKNCFELEEKLIEMKYSGITNVLALRGDNPRHCKRKSDYKYACQLVQQIAMTNSGMYRSENGYRKGLLSDFCIGVAAYPEMHPECKSQKKNIEHLKLKYESGAEFAITQMVFDKDICLKFMENAGNAGIKMPIVPGIMPISSYKQLTGFISGLNVTIPKKLLEKIERKKQDNEYAKQVSLEHLAEMCNAILPYAPGIHVFTMNKAEQANNLLDRIRVQ